MFEHELIILCGGRGTRLSSVWQLPKILAPIDKSCYLEIVLDTLLEIDCEFNLTLATGYKSEVIEERVKALDLNVSIIKEDSELGTGGAVLNFLSERNLNRFSVLNGDTLFAKKDLHGFFQKVLKTNKCHLAMQKVDLNDRFGSIDTKSYLSIQKPSRPIKDDLVFAGLATFVSSLISTKVNIPCSLEKLINESQISKEKVQLFLLNSGFYDIGTPDSLEGAYNWLQKN